MTAFQAGGPPVGTTFALGNQRGTRTKPRAPDDRRAPRVKRETRVYPRAPGRRSSAGTPKSAGPFNRIPRTPPHMNPHEQSYSVVRLFVLGSTSAYTCLKAPNPFALSVRANTVHPRSTNHPVRGFLGGRRRDQRGHRARERRSLDQRPTPDQRDPLRRRNQPPPLFNRGKKQDHPAPQSCTLLEIKPVHVVP